jgi:methionyl-tRNA formyltransferase
VGRRVNSPTILVGFRKLSRTEETAMRLIMLGNGPFAVPTLEALAKSEHEVALVVTRPPKGRDTTASPLQRAGESLGLATWSPETVNSPTAQQHLAALVADLLVVCDYGEILKSDTLKTARLGGINLHGSLLPKFRGAAPVQWAILRGEVETGNSVIQMTPGLDAGPCLGQQHTPIDPDEDAGQLEARLAKLGPDLVLEVIAKLADGTTSPIPQDASLASKAPRMKKEHGEVDWSRPALEIKNLVRGLRPWPRAFTYWRRSSGPPMRISIDRVTIANSTTTLGGPASTGVPGTVIQTASHLLVATGDDPLRIVELQPSGKRSMPAADFLQGNRVAVGDRFGPELA